MTKHALAIALSVAVLCAAGAAHAGPSNLTDRFGVGVGWGYVHGIGIPDLTGSTVTNGSVLDAPKIITTKIGLSQTLSIDPSLAIIFINYDDKISKKTPFLLRLAPVFSYALFQKEKVNFNVKGGISLSYAKEISASRYSDIIFAVPAGFGIEWWMIDNLAFDISVMTNVLAFDMSKATENGDTLSSFGIAIANLYATLSLVFWF